MYKKIFLPVITAILQITIIVLAAYFILNKGAQNIGYNWQWYQIPDFIFFKEDGIWFSGELIEGLLITIKISLVSMLVTLVIALITAMLKTSSSLIGRALANFYIETIRNTPLLVQIYLIYFILGPGLHLGRESCAILALALFQGAYSAEIIRAGLNSIATGQFEACKSLGLNKFTSYRYIILPQTFKKIIPPLTNEMVSLIKNSSIVSVMAIFDLTTVGKDLVAETAMPFEIWFSVAGFYLGLTLTLSWFAAWLEQKHTIPNT